MVNYMKKLFLALLLSASFSVSAVEWSGTVVGVADGDTVSVLNAQKQVIKVRLAEIDAPEKNQAFGQQSKQSLSDMCFKKPVIVDDRGTDKYRRTVGRIRCDGIDANLEQVRKGLAWAYRQYLTDSSIANMEDTAKAAKIGLWVDADPMPPWTFRHGAKAAKTAKPKNALASTANQCGTKSTCGEMANCSEARFYVEKCGLTQLDRDHDGVPCESICR
jgi:endonuclease YncB( thermonuclease family)